MNSVPRTGRARLRFGRFDYAAFLTFASYAASSLAIPVVLAGGASGFAADSEQLLLLARAAEDSLWSAGEEVEVDENGEEWHGIS